MTIDRDPMCSKMIRVSDEVHGMIVQSKLIPQEPHNDCIKRIIAENNYLKRHYLAEAPRESMYRELKTVVINTEIKDTTISASVEGNAHIITWNELHPDDPLLEGELIHHKNGDHNDNHPENLMKIKRNEHAILHAKMNSINNVDKNIGKKRCASEITFDVPKKVL